MMKQNKQKQSNSSEISFYMCIGMLLGVAIGCSYNNLALSISIGMLAGTGVGIGIAYTKNKSHKN